MHYDYQDPDVAPRGSVQGLTEAFNNVQLGGHQQYQQDPYYHQNQAYTHNAPPPTGGVVVGGGSAYGAPSAPSDLTSYPGGKGKAAAGSTYQESRPREKKHSSKRHRSKPSQGTGTKDAQEPPLSHVELSSLYQKASTTTTSPGHDPRSQVELENQPEDIQSTAERYSFGQGKHIAMPTPRLVLLTDAQGHWRAPKGKAQRFWTLVMLNMRRRMITAQICSRRVRVRYPCFLYGIGKFPSPA